MLIGFIFFWFFDFFSCTLLPIEDMICRPFPKLCALAALVPRFKPVVTTSFAFSATAAEKEVTKYDDYQKEMRLKQIEGAFDDAIPKLLHGSYNSLVVLLDQNSFRFEDKVWHFETENIPSAVFRMAKVRWYLAFKSPHNRFETLGTHICLDDNLVTLIWRLSWPKNAKSAYFLSPKSLLTNFSAFYARRPRSQIGRMEHKLTTTESDATSASPDSPKAQEVSPSSTDDQTEDPTTRNFTRIEQCLDVYVSDLGFVNRLVVRPVTSHDFDLAKLRKMELENEIDERWRRATREQKHRE